MFVLQPACITPSTRVSTTLEEPLDWPNATVVSGDAVDVVARLKEVTLFPVITGQTGPGPDLPGRCRLRPELVENRTLDSHIQELIYRPALH